MTEITISAFELALIEEALKFYVEKAGPESPTIARTQAVFMAELNEVIREWLIENGYSELTEENADDIVLCNEVQ